MSNDASSPLSGSELRRQDARLRAEMTQSHNRGESVEAQKLIDAFLVDVRARGIAPEPLRARLISGGEVKTDKTGWYIRANRSVAVGEDGSYYALTVPGTLMDRLRGVKLSPTLPPLVVARGGRDGESGDLAEFLAWRLQQG